jgi:DNA primase small subunit
MSILTFWNILSGRVCVPIDPSKVDQFNPESAPTISQLAAEIDKFAKDESNKVVKKDYKKTSMRESMNIFEEFLAQLSENWKGERMKQSDASLEY